MIQVVHHLSVEQMLLRTIVTCSVLHTLLPPWEALNDFPRAQKYYKLVIYTIGYIALNGRSTIYQSISTTKSQKPSEPKGDSAT